MVPLLTSVVQSVIVCDYYCPCLPWVMRDFNQHHTPQKEKKKENNQESKNHLQMQKDSILPIETLQEAMLVE